MVDNLQNTNQNPAPQGDLLGQKPSEAVGAVSMDKKNESMPAAPVAGSADPKDEKNTGLDLSGLADTVANFTTNKKDDGKAKIDFLVSSSNSAKDKAMENALFEKTFLDSMTKTITLAIVFLIVAFFGYVFQQYLQYAQ